MDNCRVLPEVLLLKEEMIFNRRWFHANPELSFQEIVTAAKVVEILRSYGISEIFENVGRTGKQLTNADRNDYLVVIMLRIFISLGVVALIRGNEPGKCCALRADMDGSS